MDFVVILAHFGGPFGLFGNFGYYGHQLRQVDLLLLLRAVSFPSEEEKNQLIAARFAEKKCCNKKSPFHVRENKVSGNQMWLRMIEVEPPVARTDIGGEDGNNRTIKHEMIPHVRVFE